MTHGQNSDHLREEGEKKGDEVSAGQNQVLITVAVTAINQPSRTTCRTREPQTSGP